MNKELDRVRKFLSSGTASELAASIMGKEPWLCRELKVDFTNWATSTLSDAQRPSSAKLFLLGSAAIGFSISPTKPGRPFRKLGSTSASSDLDLAIVDPDFFVSCWDSLVQREVVEGPRRFTNNQRAKVYWGRIDDWILPKRTPPRTDARRVVDAVRRSEPFRGYPASLRVYRREADLSNYLTHHLKSLKRELLP